jgi:hypothetical protein
MTVGERAAQVWPLLVLCAVRRQLLSYDELSRLIGIPRPGLGQVLEPIQSYCILTRLPALSSLVVSHDSGMPGTGFIAATDVPREQAAVFRRAWFTVPVPTPQNFQDAVQQLPSNGRSLSELLHIAAVADGSGPKEHA